MLHAPSRPGPFPRGNALGARFVAALNEVKTLEYDAYQRVISSWERENLLLNV